MFSSSLIPPISINDYQEYSQEEIQVPRSTSGTKLLGFTIQGGIDAPFLPKVPSIFVTNIHENSPAHNSKRLKLYDMIVSVNGIDFTNIKHELAVQILKNSGPVVNLLVRHRTPSTASQINLKRNDNMNTFVGDRVNNDHLPNCTSQRNTTLNPSQEHPLISSVEELSVKTAYSNPNYEASKIATDEYNKTGKQCLITSFDSDDIKRYERPFRSIIIPNHSRQTSTVNEEELHATRDFQETRIAGSDPRSYTNINVQNSDNLHEPYNSKRYQSRLDDIVHHASPERTELQQTEIRNCTSADQSSSQNEIEEPSNQASSKRVTFRDQTSIYQYPVSDSQSYVGKRTRQTNDKTIKHTDNIESSMTHLPPTRDAQCQTDLFYAQNDDNSKPKASVLVDQNERAVLRQYPPSFFGLSTQDGNTTINYNNPFNEVLRISENESSTKPSGGYNFIRSVDSNDHQKYKNRTSYNDHPDTLSSVEENRSHFIGPTTPTASTDHQTHHHEYLTNGKLCQPLYTTTDEQTSREQLESKQPTIDDTITESPRILKSYINRSIRQDILRSIAYPVHSWRSFNE